MCTRLNFAVVKIVIMEFGTSTFGEITADNEAGGAKNAAKRMSELVEEAKLAE